MTYSEIRAADLYAARNLERMEAVGRARQTEATWQQRIATGAAWGGGGYPDSDLIGFRPLDGGGHREVPERTREQARMDSVVGYRANPMARAIIDTYTGFCVGDSGLTLQCTSDEVRPIAESFWKDRRNCLSSGKEIMFRTWLLEGEQLQEMMVGELTGVCRRSPIAPTRIAGVALVNGNPLWPASVAIRGPQFARQELTVIDVDDMTGLRTGQAFFWPAFKALESDTRGYPFLAPVLDWLDSYDTVMSNLIDRTALMRYIGMDVTVKGADQKKVADYITANNGAQIPRSGTQFVHNESVEVKPLQAQTGSFEDTNTGQSVMTNIAAGTGLAKTWLAEPEDANRATSLSMAEPVRRRVGSVQNEWLENLAEMPRYAVDQAVARGRIPAMVTVKVAGGGSVTMPAADTVSVTGPQVAQADAKVTAEVLVNLSQALVGLVQANVLSLDASQVAAQKAWEDFVGVPFREELAAPDANPNDVATHVDENGGGRVPLVAV